MKHIFYIHSYITYIVALGTIRTERIEENNVILILGRDFKSHTPPEEYKIFFNIGSHGAKLGLIRYNNKIRAFDNWVASLTKDNDFVLYLPNKMNYFSQLFASHNNCIGVHLIEEGLLLYARSFDNIIKNRKVFYKKNIKDFFRRFLHFLDHANRTSYYLDIEYKIPTKVFTISSLSKINLSTQDVVIVPLLANEIPLDNKFILKNASIFFMDALYEQNFADRKKINTIFSKFIRENLKNFNELYLKFHPTQSDEIKNDVLSVLEENKINYQIIPHDVSAELMFVKSENLYVYGFFSSVLFYAGIMNHQSFSLSEQLAKIDEDYNKYLKIEIPEIAKEKVKFIN
jgi:hypothetical protein